MFTLDLNDLELKDSATAGGPIRVTFPFHSGTGTASTAAVLFELEPGSALATHTDSAEEILFVLEGEGEAHVGETPLRVLGFFSSSTVVSTFEEFVGPEGENVAVFGATAPIFVRSEEPSTLAV